MWRQFWLNQTWFAPISDKGKFHTKTNNTILSTDPLNSSKWSQKWDFETITIASFLSQKLKFKITTRKHSMLGHLLEIVTVFLYFQFFRFSFLNKETDPRKTPELFLIPNYSYSLVISHEASIYLDLSDLLNIFNH